MILVNRDRDLAVRYDDQYEQQLHTMPNIRDGQIKEVVLYLDNYMLADYDNAPEALREMEMIAEAIESGQRVYQVGDYELSESDLELVERLRRCFFNNPELVEMLEEFD